MLLAALCLSLAGVCLTAHPLSVSYAHIVIGDVDVVVTMRLPLDDMDLLLRLDRDLDGSVSDGEISAAAPALHAYLGAHIVLRADGVAGAGALEKTARWPDSTGFPYVEATLRYPVVRPPAAVAIQVRVLSDLYAGHRTLGDIEWGPRREEFVFQNGNTFEGTAVSTGWWRAARTFLALGVEHILTGYDHLLFLVGLLVAGRGIPQLVAIVSSFTVAHSLTLAAATLGFISPPPRLVEAVIALSIAYVGIENLLAREVRGRWKLAFAFGLVHGFGFANVLREMELPRQALASSLFTFNLGVEIGQLGVVVLLWPLLRWVQGSSYAAPVTRWTSAVITVCGLGWFVQRMM
ncbi:MAG: HupE/UreJ family protein [Acidobacteriota bacterium]|nr:HupE/UreJ family protein [Acidobacteriota bacterium]